MNDSATDKLGRTARIGNGSTPRRDRTIYWDGGDVPWLNSSVVNESRVTRAEQFVTAVALRECHLPVVTPGSVLVGLTGQGKTRGMATILDIEATVNQHIAYVTPDRSRWSPEYLVWSLRAAYDELRHLSEENGSTKGGLTCEALKQFRLAAPPLDEQRCVAAHLDRETARIDTLIEEQRRLIEMLRERRWAVVERGVALLDWNTPFKTVATLIQTGPFGSQLKSDEYEDDGIPLINPSHIVAGEVVPDPRIAVGAEKSKQLARHRLEEGDLIAARRGDLGRCAVVGPPAAGFLCGTGSAIVRLDRERVDPSFAAIVFSSRRNRDALALASVGSTMENLNSDIIGALRFPVPPIDEQRRLTTELEQATAKIDTLIAETERFVELARERRAALITAAVTG